jgi:hypothetical protein
MDAGKDARIAASQEAGATIRELYKDAAMMLHRYSNVS